MPSREKLRQNARQVAENIEGLFPGLGMVGMGEFIAGGFVTTALDPIEIARDMAPNHGSFTSQEVADPAADRQFGLEGWLILCLRTALGR